MVFSSSIFIFLFLPLVLLFYFIVPDKYKNYVLLIFSIIFYLFGGPKYLLLLITVVLIDYIGAILIEKTNNRKLFFVITIALNISILVFFKYTGFFLENINGLFNTSIKIPRIVLPIGISFYTFQAMSYVIDVYRKKVKLQKNFFTLLLYVSLFPQLVAGPIVRYETIEKQLSKRKTTFEDFCYGIERFILGLSKKVIIANQMGKLADSIFISNNLTSPIAFLGGLAYMFQIYFDFSAYSDMAIGMGRMFGFKFLENFNFPYISKSITEFWRRWHISLSTWFKDYVYIPLGGNRKGIKRQIINMFIVWSLTGFWHGAEWNFIIWGIYYFIFLVLEKYVLKKALDTYITVLAPLAPHFAEEEWEILGHKTSVHKEEWPKYSEKDLEKKTLEIPVQINGKVKMKVKIDVDMSKEEIGKLIKEDKQFIDILGNGAIKNEIYVPGRIYSIQI